MTPKDFHIPKLAFLLILALVGCTAFLETPDSAQISVPLPTDRLLGSGVEVTLSRSSIPLTPTTTQTATPMSVVTSIAATPVIEPTQSALTTTLPTGAIEIEKTLILYTTLANSGLALTVPDETISEDSWAFRTLPSLSFLNPRVFDSLYGRYQYHSTDDVNLRFLYFRPQLSPDNRYLLVPGVGSIPEENIMGTGLWLIDLFGQTARQLLTEPRITTWSPISNAITYVADDTLYTLDITEGSEPRALFQRPELSVDNSQWSPDGHYIAVLTSDPEPKDPEGTLYSNTYWLVPTSGDPPSMLAERLAGAIQRTPDEMSWSPDGQYLLIRNEVFDLSGNALSPDYSGAVSWLPNDTQLLVNGPKELRIATIADEEIAHIANVPFPATFAWSHDGQRLAYLPGQGPNIDVDAQIAIYDVVSGNNRVVGTVPQVDGVRLLRWSADDSRLILGLSREGQDEIWAVDAQAGSAPQLLLGNALLIEVVPYPLD